MYVSVSLGYVTWTSILYTIKRSRGKTFTIRVGNRLSPENFHGTILVDLYC